MSQDFRNDPVVGDKWERVRDHLESTWSVFYEDNRDANGQIIYKEVDERVTLLIMFGFIDWIAAVWYECEFPSEIDHYTEGQRMGEKILKTKKWFVEWCSKFVFTAENESKLAPLTAESLYEVRCTLVHNFILPKQYTDLCNDFSENNPNETRSYVSFLYEFVFHGWDTAMRDFIDRQDKCFVEKLAEQIEESENKDLGLT